MTKANKKPVSRVCPMKQMVQLTMALVGVLLVISGPCRAGDDMEVNTWIPLFTKFGKEVSELAFDPAIPGIIYGIADINAGGGKEGFLPVKSSDFGATWEPIVQGIESESYAKFENYAEFIGKFTAEEKLLYFFMKNNEKDEYKLFRSSDDGIHWENISDIEGMSPGGLSISPVDETMFLSRCLSGNRTEIMRSNNGGRNWETVTSIDSSFQVKKFFFPDSIPISYMRPQMYLHTVS